MRTAVGVGALAAAMPSLLSLGPVRNALTPRLVAPAFSGRSATGHVAITFDDGPDPRSTPLFLALLAKHEVRATFFVLGRHVRANAGLVRAMAVAGHELAVHGWDHRPVAAHRPRTLRDGIARTRDLVEDACGREVAWYRPPYGLVTPVSWWAARSAGLHTVLWSAWGRDWERAATPASVVRSVSGQLRPGGTVLLHDSDRTSAAGSWRTTLTATDQLLASWREAGLSVGPLADHWRETAPEDRPTSAENRPLSIGAVRSLAGETG